MLLASQALISLSDTLEGNGNVNLAKGKKVFASSTENTRYPAIYAVDGDQTTRWSSRYTDSEWIYVDLGQEYIVDRVILYWERAFGTEYSVQTSQDGSTWQIVSSITNGNGGVDDITIPSVRCRYVKMQGVKRATKYGFSIYEFEIYGRLPQPTEIFGKIPIKSATASSVETYKYQPEYAIDGNITTRWSSKYLDNQWLELDLGEPLRFNHVNINWENAYAKEYAIQVSSDRVTWSDAYRTQIGDGRIDDFTFEAVQARYVRLLGITRATKYGFSLWEIEIYNDPPLIPGNEPAVETHFINVGFGDSILIKTPDQKVMLIDAGKAAATPIVIEYLKNHNINKIDMLVYTHNHDDHLGDVPLLMNSFNIGGVLLPNVTAYEGRFYTVMQVCKQKGIKPIALKAGDTLAFGENVSWSVVGPVNQTALLINDLSLVLRMKYGDVAFLFTGDAEATEESDILNAGYDISANVLKVAHHGMTTSTTDAFLAGVNPQYAVLSTLIKLEQHHGWIDATVVKLTNAGIKIYNTGNNGNIIIKTNGKDIAVGTQYN